MTNLRSVRLLTSYTIAISILTAFIWFFLPSFNITQLTDKLTIIQMLLNMVLLIPSLLLLITQIWENNTAPRLDLEMKIYREDSRQSDSLFIPTQGEEVQTLQISLMNDGNAVALWYIIRIFIPKDLIHSAQDVDLRPIVGHIPVNWKPSFPNKDRQDSFLLTFLSNREFASYPQDGLILAHLRIRIDSTKKYNSAYRIRYFIKSEKGTPQREKNYTVKIKST